MSNSWSKCSEEKAVIVKAQMPTWRLLEDFIKLKKLWQPKNGIISKRCFKDISRIFQKEGVISPANSEVLEKYNELYSRKMRSSFSLSDLHWIEICKRGGFQIGGRIIQLLGYPFRVPLFSGLIWVLFEADNNWTVWFWIIGLILACFLSDYIFTTSCYYFFPSRAVVVRDSADGSVEEPSIAQDIPPPDHDQSCNSQPHYEEDLDSSSSNDSPDGSAEEPSIAQDIPPPDHDQSCDLQVISPANSEVLEQRNDIFFGEESTSSSSSSDDSPDGSTEEPSIAQDIPPPDHDQSCNYQPHYEEDLDFSSSNDSPDGSAEELSNTQNVQRYEEDFIEIGEPIGEGGFGKVFKVQHKLDKKHYAIKEIKVTKRKSCFFQREITTLARLDHHNVVRYHQSWYGTEFQRVSQPPLQGLGSLNGFEGEEEEEEEEGKEQEGVNSCLYIQMELCSGSLRTWLKDRFEMNEKENQDIYKQMLEGMNYIHSQGIVHRDLTPKNIFLINKDDGHPLVKIGDFGLAREYRYVLTEPKTPMRSQRDQDLDKSSVDPDVSQTYTSGIGTETYAAPEQLKGGKYNNKADMFSLGLILFELHHPFGTVMERCDCLGKLREGNFPEEFQERWPVQYSAIKCLTRKDSQERPSASDLLSGDMFPSKDKSIQILEEENKRLKKLIKQRDETADI